MSILVGHGFLLGFLLDVAPPRKSHFYLANSLFIILYIL
jgi:hypothetical protein